MSESNNSSVAVSSINETMDINKYDGHFVLAARKDRKEGGLLGKICIVAFLVDDRAGAWKDDSIEHIKSVLQKASVLLKEHSRLTDNRLQISYAFDTVPVQYKFDRDRHERVLTDVLEQYGVKDVSSYQKRYKRKFDKSEAPLIFFIKRNFRSFASKHGAVDNSGRFSFVAFNENTDANVRTLIHELLHQFGAIDLYLPESVKNAAREFFPESIMLHGNEIDDLTRYLIGWDKRPSETVFKFLEATKDVTEEEIKTAREEDNDNDW